MKDELLDLIHSTREFAIGIQLSHQLIFTQKNKAKFEKKEKILPIPKATTAEKTEVVEVALPKKTSIEKTAIENFELSRFDEMKSLFKKSYPHLFREELPSFIILATKEERYLPFLKKVAMAISDTIAPANVCLCKNEAELLSLLQSHSLKLLIASKKEIESLLNEKQDAAEYAISKLHKSSWLALDSIENYIKDPHQKRTLWTILQTLPLSDLLQ